MVVKKLSVFILLFVLVSCGARDQKHYPVLLKGQITTGIPKSYVGDNKLISSITRQDLILDTDRDGIIDRDDFDIDNDGVPNDCDQAPFDARTGKSDVDKDGIPDFCDLEDGFQSEVFFTYGIMLNMNEQKLDSRNFDLVIKMISGKTILPNRKLVTLTVTKSLPAGEYGVYDQDWTNIRLKTDESYHEEFPQIKNSDWTLVHELFHFVGFTNQKLYSAFNKRYVSEKKSDVLMYPSEYSKVSEEEFFAEENTFQYFFSNKI